MGSRVRLLTSCGKGYLFQERINLAESGSRKRIALACFLRIVAGQISEMGPSRVFFTASALVGAGTIQ